jgi:hypothetical protein
MSITTEKWVLVERGPRAGLEPETKFFDTAQEAKQWVQPRLAAFERFDLAKVQYRVTVEMVPKITEVEEA